jgi:hypothetical protein
MLLVYRYRIKSLTGLLNSQARACNFVWNFCNEIQQQALKWNKRWPTGFDLNRLTAGSSKELALHARTMPPDSPRPAWRSLCWMHAGLPSEACSATKRLRTGLATRKSMNRSLPESVRFATARRGRKVSQTSE